MNDFDEDGENTPKKNYEIGYGQPPKETQFKPGQSGNPKGRKRKPKSVAEQMRKVMQKKVPINEGGKTKSLPLQEVILRNLANKAAKGDLKAMSFAFNLISVPEFDEADSISKEHLSEEDQAMLENVMKQLIGEKNTVPSEQTSPIEGESELYEVPNDGEDTESLDCEAPDAEDLKDEG